MTEVGWALTMTLSVTAPSSSLTWPAERESPEFSSIFC
jgi:hypothetical protein